MSHVLLLHLFNRDLNPRFQVFGHLHQSELTLTKRLFEFVKIKNITVSHNLLELFFPPLFFPFCFKVEVFLPVRRNVDLQLIVTSVLKFFVHHIFNFAFFLITIANITPSQTVHVLMFLISHVFIDVEFITFEGKEMRYKFLRIQSKKAFTRIKYEIFSFLQEILNEWLSCRRNARTFFMSFTFHYSSLSVRSFFFLNYRVANYIPAPF